LKGFNSLEKKIQQSNDYINVLDLLKKGLPSTFSKTGEKNVVLTSMVGVIPNENVFKFQKMLFRMSRGNVFATY